MGRGGRQGDLSAGPREKIQGELSDAQARAGAHLAREIEVLSEGKLVLDPLAASLLPTNSAREALLWLRGDRSLLQEPEEVCPGMEAAAADLLVALQRGERVALFCDYDVDGVAGGEVLREAIIRHGQEPLMGYARASEGFGLREDFVRQAHKEGCSTIVTVDCGSKSLPAIALAKELGMKVIVTDHHDIADPEKNKADHHINPQLHTPRPSMATGSQVAWHLGAALLSGAEGQVPEEYYGEPLYLAGLGCVADWGPHRLSENRPFLLADTPPPGVRLLAETKGEDASSLHLIWKTSAALNMAKRTDAVSGADAARIIRAETEEEAAAAAAVIEQARKEQDSAKRQLEKEIESVQSDGPVAFMETDLENVSGLAGGLALRLAAQSDRPAFIFAPLREEDGETIYKFSGRVPASSELEIIGMSQDPEIAEMLLAGGGHARVFSGECRGEDIPKLQRAMSRWAGSPPKSSAPREESSSAVLEPRVHERLVRPERLEELRSSAEALGPFHKVDGHFEPRVSVRGKIGKVSKRGWQRFAELETDSGAVEVELARGVEETEGEIVVHVRSGGQAPLAQGLLT